MRVSRRIAIQEAEQEVERLLALVDVAGDRGAVDEAPVRQALQRIAASCAEMGDISATCEAARGTYKASLLRPSDLHTRQRFRDALADLRGSMREARRALTANEWPVIEPVPASGPVLARAPVRYRESMRTPDPQH